MSRRRSGGRVSSAKARLDLLLVVICWEAVASLLIYLGWVLGLIGGFVDGVW